MICIINYGYSSNLLVTSIGVADIHHSLYGSPGVNGATRIQAVQDAGVNNNAQFIFNTGDNIYEEEVQENHILQMQSFESLWANTSLDHWTVFGNHDYKVTVTPQLTKNETIDLFNSSLGGNDYYYKDYNNTRFIFLSGSYTNNGTTWGFNSSDSPPDIPQVELDWLNNTLNDALNLSYFSVIILHYRLDDVVYGTGNNAAVNNILYSYNKTVIAVLQGHEHENRYSLINGIHYISFYSPVLHSYNANNYAIIKIYDDYINIDGVGSVTDRNLTINRNAINNYENSLIPTSNYLKINIDIADNKTVTTNYYFQKNNKYYITYINEDIINWLNIAWEKII